MSNKICINIKGKDYNFYIIKLLGEGSQSKVYKARKENEFNYCAIKIFSRKLLENPKNSFFRDLVNNEYLVHNNLNHENIVKLLSYGKDKNNYY